MKATRTVLRRERGGNSSDLADKSASTVLRGAWEAIPLSTRPFGTFGSFLPGVTGVTEPGEIAFAVCLKRGCLSIFYNCCYIISYYDFDLFSIHIGC